MENIYQGQAAVYLVTAQLILRGVKGIYFPAVDDGVDLMAGGLRVQVKSTRSVSKHWRLPEGSYNFTMSKSQTIKGGVYIPRRARKFSSVCDFVVMVAIDDNRYWIVPAHLLDGRTTAIISPTHQWKKLDVEYLKALRESGLSYPKIAGLVGSNQRTVSRRINLKGKPDRKQTMAQIKEYENRWDLLLSYSNTISEANEAASAPQGETQCRQV